MYHLPYFKAASEEEVTDFVKEYPFAIICGCINNQPVATQIPMFLDKREQDYTLSGHMMKNTDHHKALMENDQVLVIFPGPDTYVSASWYPNPIQASTWNYISVHCKGKIQFGDDKMLMDVLKRTTDYFESEDSVSGFTQLPEDYINQLKKAIVPFEIVVEKMENVFKLSQNHDEETYYNIIAALRNKKGDAAKIAEIMEQRASKVFPK